MLIVWALVVAADVAAVADVFQGVGAGAWDAVAMGGASLNALDVSGVCISFFETILFYRYWIQLRKLLLQKK